MMMHAIPSLYFGSNADRIQAEYIKMLVVQESVIDTPNLVPTILINKVWFLKFLAENSLQLMPFLNPHFQTKSASFIWTKVLLFTKSRNWPPQTSLQTGFSQNLKLCLSPGGSIFLLANKWRLRTEGDSTGYSKPIIAWIWKKRSLDPGDPVCDRLQDIHCRPKTRFCMSTDTQW